MKRKDITPLTEFPTEVLVYYFKKLRKCYTSERIDKQIGVEKRWSLVLNDYYELPIWSVRKETSTYGHYPDDTLWFDFERMYWEGSITELKKELDKRPHVNIHTSKDFRKWKIEYKKLLQN